MNRSDMSILHWGAASTACGYFAPPYSMVVISSRGDAFSIALTNTSTGFFLVFCSMSVNAFMTMVTAVSPFPPHRPELMKCFFALCPGTWSLFINRSTTEYSRYIHGSEVDVFFEAWVLDDDACGVPFAEVFHDHVIVFPSQFFLLRVRLGFGR